jgi:hypothetical protein
MSLHLRSDFFLGKWAVLPVDNKTQEKGRPKCQFCRDTKSGKDGKPCTVCAKGGVPKTK